MSVIHPSLRSIRGSSPLTAMNWAGQYGSYWSVSSNVASGGTGTTSNGDNLLGGLLPSTDCYFEIEIDRGQEAGGDGVNFLGVAYNWTPGDYYVWSSAGHSDWYWSGNWYVDGGTGASAPATLIAGRYRFALDYTNGRLYGKRISGTPTSVGYCSLPSGWSSTAIRPLLIPQGGYQATATATLHGYASGSGGLF